MANLIFIPTNDLSDKASDAEQIDELDFGLLFVETPFSLSFRLGNPNNVAIEYLWWIIQGDELEIFPADQIDLPPAGPLGPNETTDTLSLTLHPEPEDGNKFYSFRIGAMSSIGDTEISARMWVLLDTVSDRDKRRTASRRSTSQTDVFSTQIDRMAEPILLLRYDPVAFDPNDRRVIIEPGARNLCDDGGVTFKTVCDPCDRLDPNDADWGYVLSESWIRGVFQPESDSVTLQFTKDKTSMTYESTSRLVLPVEFDSELQRAWALFDPKTAADRAQYKRSVFIFQRGSEFWVMQDIVQPPLGEISTYLETDLIQLHNASMGSQMFYNPFSIVYEQDSNKPYQVFPCDVSFIPEALADGSSLGSDGSNPSNPSNPSPSNPSDPSTPTPSNPTDDS